jgi:hypothetical protein
LSHLIHGSSRETAQIAGQSFYHDVLATNSAAELTPVMCAFDKAWIEAIDPAAHGFRFDSATTIGHGGTCCPFHFTRTRPDLAASS